MSMSRSQVLALLADNRDEIVRRFAVKGLSVFGSAARDEMHEGSDVDILVEIAPEIRMDVSGMSESSIASKICFRCAWTFQTGLRSNPM